MKRKVKRIHRELTEAEKLRLEQYREEISKELPDLHVRDQMRKEAREEATLGGQLRRSIQMCDLSLGEIAVRAGLPPLVLDEFLTGERTLRSDIIDRVAIVVGYELDPAL